MTLWHIFIIALAISIDAFSISFAVANRVHGAHAIFRISFHFGMFQGLMPFLGWVLGSQLSAIIGRFDHWIAFALLTAIAVRMFIESLKPHEVKKKFDPSKGLSLVALSISVSIDALGVGIGMGILNSSILVPCIIYGIFTGLMSCLGIYLGKGLKSIVGRRAETVGAIILFIVALHLLKI